MANEAKPHVTFGAPDVSRVFPSTLYHVIFVSTHCSGSFLFLAAIPTESFFNPGLPSFARNVFRIEILSY